MKGVTTNGAKRASSIIDKLKFKTIYKNKDIHLIPDTDKYDVLDRIIARIQDKAAKGETFAGRRIDSVLTVNGARIMLDNGAWGLVRASSNTPNLVVVCESPESDAELRQIFADLDAVIRTEPLVGAYDQTL